MIGQMLGPYRVLEKLGEGGMGEVYKARDTRLDRTVAIKVLPPTVAADPERRARFEREAKTIAGLTHPHICTLYDVGEYPSTGSGQAPSTGSASSPQAGSGQAALYLVMEHLTGETLAQRLQKGPLPLDQALGVATEIADALSAAHRQGVIHRDLKPGNVMLTKAGAARQGSPQAKLLDFGLAKLKGHGEQPAAAHLASAPTQFTPLTGEGMIVGTLQYMAPEQLEGKPADARTDLWALGAILYEMVTGKRAFEGTSAASLIGAILEREPAPLAALQPLTPPGVDRLVQQCLAKAPDDRPDTAHDVASQLRSVQESSRLRPVEEVPPRRARWHTLALAAVFTLVGVLAGATVSWLGRPPAASSPGVVRSLLDVRPAEELRAGDGSTPGGPRTALAWTPDGQALVFVGRQGGVQRLYVRRLDAVEARPLPNTEGAQVPAVSPDGQWIAFWANGAIRRVPLGGGLVTDLQPAAVAPLGLAWDNQGRLLIGAGPAGIVALSADGTRNVLTNVGDTELWHELPRSLPGGRAFLYTARKRIWSWGDEEIVCQTVDGARRVLLKNAADARYVPTGHLVFLRQGRLFAAPFDPERPEEVGSQVPVLDEVAQALTESNSANSTGAGQFAIAQTGTLAWVPSPVVPHPERMLVTVDRAGRVTPLPAPVRSYAPRVRVSPDGRWLAVTIRTLTDAGLWLYDLQRGTLTPRNRDGESNTPLWAPDGKWLAFAWITSGRDVMGALPSDGSAPASVLANERFAPSSFTPDGRHIVGARLGPGGPRAGQYDIVIGTVEDGKARVQSPVGTPGSEMWPEISPDGGWLAYGSNVSGRFEVYVRPYPGPGPAEPVSLEGGTDPAWHRNGRELFFLTPADGGGRRRMMVATFEPASPPRIGKPRRLFEVGDELNFVSWPVRGYDVAADGLRFYVTQERPLPPPAPVTHINLIQNWLEELKAKVPAYLPAAGGRR